MFNNYQLPNTSLLGASGTRVLILQAHASTYLQIGLASPGQLYKEGVTEDAENFTTVELISQ